LESEFKIMKEDVVQVIIGITQIPKKAYLLLELIHKQGRFNHQVVMEVVHSK
jgi:hypothetical protein